MQVSLSNTVLANPCVPSVEVSLAVPGRMHVYLEATDAGGKDSVAIAIDEQRRLCGAKTAKAAGFFSPEVNEYMCAWRKKHPELDEGGLLLAATVYDLMRMNENPVPSSDMNVQISHNSIRGAAFQHAFGLPYDELFTRSTDLLPNTYLPIALTATIPELQRRVKANPHATQFDYLVCEKPETIEKLVNTISAHCERLGGTVIDTTSVCPSEIASSIVEGIDKTVCPTDRGEERVRAMGHGILSDLCAMNDSFRPVLQDMRLAHE